MDKRRHTWNAGLFGRLLWSTLGEMATDEMKARLEDVPAKLVAAALWRLPTHLRDEYRPEWEDDLLAAYEEKNARYPITKLVCAVRFVWPLFVHARSLRTEFEMVRQAGLADERNEKLATREGKLARLLNDSNRRAVIGGISLQYRTREVVWREAPDGSFKLDLATPWPGESDVTITEHEGEDCFIVTVRHRETTRMMRSLGLTGRDAAGPFGS
ncbi:hypothetical protein NWT09_31145 [Mycolicibacterium sp. jd]|uniref:hypothetical protein n=1 Tax=unclassified Mycolicibacterium TaxID=2636767 RepID=UPI00351B7785